MTNYLCILKIVRSQRFQFEQKSKGLFKALYLIERLIRDERTKTCQIPLKNMSQLVMDGMNQYMDLFKMEDKTSTTSYIVTFILSLTEKQLSDLNIELLRISSYQI